MIREQTNKRTALRRRTYPKPTLYAKGITCRDRLFLWYLAYRLPVRKLPLEADLTFEVLEEACRKCRYPQWRLREIRYDYPLAWERMLVKRAHRLCGTKDPQSTEGRVRAASMTDTTCRHPRIARAIGWPYYGSYSKPRNYSRPLREGEAPYGAHIHAREEAEASQPQVIGAQKEAECGEIAERDDPTAIRINGMNEPTARADQPNEHRQAEEAFLAAIEKGVPLSLACCRAGVSCEFFHQRRKENPEFESAVARACQRRVFQSVKSLGPARL
jgi:hypothetical protein